MISGSARSSTDYPDQPGHKIKQKECLRKVSGGIVQICAEVCRRGENKMDYREIRNVWGMDAKEK